MNANTAAAVAPILGVHGLTFSYPQRHVFTDWSHDFPAGLTWVRGGNGSGKSTLLKLLAGALQPLMGSVDVQGVDVQKQPMAYRRAVFWCGPGPVAFDHLSPVEYFGFMRTLYPTMEGTALGRHVDGFGLMPFLDLPLCTLSTGTQRKVWLALALSAGTQVTLLDEPMNALDQTSSEHFRTSLSACASAPTQAWIVASHEPLGATQARLSVLDLNRPD